MTELEEIEMEVLGFLYEARNTDKVFKETTIFDNFDKRISLVHLIKVYDLIVNMFYVDHVRDANFYKTEYFKINTIGEHRYLRLREMKSRKTWRELPKKYWLAVALFAYVFGLLSPIIVEWSKRKIWPESNQPDKKVEASPPILDSVMGSDTLKNPR